MSEQYSSPGSDDVDGAIRSARTPTMLPDDTVQVMSYAPVQGSGPTAPAAPAVNGGPCTLLILNAVPEAAAATSANASEADSNPRTNGRLTTTTLHRPNPRIRCQPSDHTDTLAALSRERRISDSRTRAQGRRIRTITTPDAPAPPGPSQSPLFDRPPPPPPEPVPADGTVPSKVHPVLP